MRWALVFVLWGNPALPSDRDPWFGRDKVFHFAASALTTLTVGIGKELWDRHQKRDFSLRDLAWDGIGGVAGAVAVRQIDKAP
ncbi:MAG: hypothetical protein NTX19_11745 [Gemmatimonadetes bacterium]|nr:hypothetical protein [Gemmatimonadota bacterium]